MSRLGTSLRLVPLSHPNSRETKQNIALWMLIAITEHATQINQFANAHRDFGVQTATSQVQMLKQPQTKIIRFSRSLEIP